MKVPKEGTKKYKEIVARGCGGYWENNSNAHEFDCEHGYDWDCDYCPCTTENMKNRRKKYP